LPGTNRLQNYEFIKPSHFREGLARILGVGILLAEGDEHKKQRKDLMSSGLNHASSSST
jgi:hypothetical protein